MSKIAKNSCRKVIFVIFNMLNKTDTEKKKLSDFQKNAIFTQNSKSYVLSPMNIFVDLT